MEAVRLLSPAISSVEPFPEAERTRYLRFSRDNSQFQLSLHGIPGLTIPAACLHSTWTSSIVRHPRIFHQKGHLRSEYEAGVLSLRAFPPRIRSDSIHYVYNYSPCPSIDLDYGVPS
jgi:hypothetical protein